MIEIMFVCHGNICRSPKAEFIFKDMIEKQGVSKQFYVQSCATDFYKSTSFDISHVYQLQKRYFW